MQIQRAPAISIGMPTYNGERFIARAIESVLGQTFADFELLISDNASTDRTGDICVEYARRDPRVHYIRQPRNVGAEANFACVRDLATAPLFAWAADDDERDATYFELLHARMDDDAVALAFGTVESIDASGALIRRYPAFRYESGHFRRSLRFFLDREDSAKACLIYGLFRKSVLQQVPFAAYYGSTVGQDMHLVFDVMQRGRIAIEPRAVFRPRVYPIQFHRSTGWVRDTSGLPLTARIFRVVNTALRLDHIPYALAYAPIARGTLLRATLALLAPVKYLQVLTCNAVALAAALGRRLRGG